MGLLEIHSQKTDNEVASRHGFGCGDYTPGNGSSRCRGLLLHDIIIRDPLTKSKGNQVPYPKDSTCYTKWGHVSWGMAKKKLPPEALAYFVKMGKKGGLIGGHARAAKLTAEERSESARKAVTARWQRAKANEDK